MTQLYQKVTPAQEFFWQFCEFFMNTFFNRTPVDCSLIVFGFVFIKKFSHVSVIEVGIFFFSFLQENIRKKKRTYYM